MKCLRGVRSLLDYIFLSCGGFEFSRILTRNKPKVLMLHRFSTEPSSKALDLSIFSKQLDLLQTKFNVIPLPEMISCLQQKRPFPKHAVVLTVDDGYEDFYTVAFPELKRRAIPATVFVTTGFIEKETWLWPDYTHYLLTELSDRKRTFELSETGQSFLVSKQYGKCFQAIMNILTPLPLDKKLAWIFAEAAKADVVFPAKIPEQFSPMSWQQIQELDANGITIGAHTVNHPNLSREKIETVQVEVKSCKKILERKLNHEVDLFCYPNGEQYDYTPEVQKIVTETGFHAAMAAHCDYTSLGNLFALPRYSVSHNMDQFRKVVFGVRWLANVILKR